MCENGSKKTMDILANMFPGVSMELLIYWYVGVQEKNGMSLCFLFLYFCLKMDECAGIVPGKGKGYSGFFQIESCNLQ